MGRLGVNFVRNTQVMTVSFDARDKALAAKVANAAAEAYIESGLEARLEMTQKATSWLTERLEGLRKQVEAS